MSSSNVDLYFLIFIAFWVCVNGKEDEMPLPDQILIYGDFKVKGRLSPTNAAATSNKLLLINFDAYQRKMLPVLTDSANNNDSSSPINCSSPAIWIDRYKIDRPSNFDQYRDLMLFYSFTVLERCVDVLPQRMLDSFLRNGDANFHIYLLIFVDGHHSGDEYSEKLSIILQSKISAKATLGGRIYFFQPVQLDQNLQNVLGSIRPVPDAGQPVQPAPDRPTFTLFAADAAEPLSIMPCEMTPISALGALGDPSLSLSAGGGVTSTGGNGSPSTLIPSNESLLNSFSRTSVLFVSVSFIILMVISLAWLVFYYVQRFRYNHAKDRLDRRLRNAVKKVLTRVPDKTLKFGDKELEADCPVCIEPYRNGDVVRSLPSCRHIFHKSCVDPWLLEHRTCPMCKGDILKAYGYNIGHHMPDVDHLSTGGHSTDGRGVLSRHHHRSRNHQHHRGSGGGTNGLHRLSMEAGSLGSGGTLNGYGMGVATDSDLHDPFFPSMAPSPSLLQPVLHQANTQAFSIIPLTVHNIGPPGPAIVVRPATCATTSPLQHAEINYNHSAASSDDDSPSSTSSVNATSKPLFRATTTKLDGRTTLLVAGRFRSAQTGRRRWLRSATRPVLMGLASHSVDEASLSLRAATRNAAGRSNTPRSSSSHDLCFVERDKSSPQHSDDVGRRAVVDPPSPPCYSMTPHRGSKAAASLESL